MKPKQDDGLGAGGCLDQPRECPLGGQQPPEIVGQVNNLVLEAIRRLWWRAGTVNLSGRVSRLQTTGSGHGGLLPTHATDFRPDLEFLSPGSSMLCGSDVIAAEVE
jgi:hypothetical protein